LDFSDATLSRIREKAKRCTRRLSRAGFSVRQAFNAEKFQKMLQHAARVGHLAFGAVVD
jgi:hypothetical protein